MDQNYKNHSQIVPFYYVAYLLTAISIALAFWNLGRSWSNPANRFSAIILCLLGLALLLITFYTRSFALKAQDRAIRAEENFRHFVLTGKPLDIRLRMGQIIALRFANDAEFIVLATKAADEKMRPKEIKEAIQEWRADYWRV